MAQKMSFKKVTVSKGPIVEEKWRNLENIINRITSMKSDNTKTKSNSSQTPTYKSRRPNEEHLHFNSLETLLKYYLKTEHPNTYNPSHRIQSSKVILTSRDHVWDRSKIHNKIPVILSHRAPKAKHLYIRNESPPLPYCPCPRSQ